MTLKIRNQHNIKCFHPRASKLIETYGHDFEQSLKLQSKIIASQSSADLVLSNHVEEALEKVRSAKKHDPRREFCMVIGSAFFGVFVQGFIAELYGGNSLLIAIYTILGFFGISLVFWGLQK